MRRYIIQNILLFAGALCSIGLQAQNPFRDSLKDHKLSKVEMLDLYKRESNFTRKAILGNEIGLKYQREMKLDSAYFYHFKAVEFTQNKSEDPDEYAVSLNKVGIIHFYWGNVDSARYYFKKSISNYSDISLKANSHSNLGLIEKQSGNPDLAMKEYLNAIALFKQAGEVKKMVNVLNNVSALHKQRKNYEQSKKYAREAMILADKHVFEEEYYESIINLAISLSFTDSVDHSISYYNKVIQFARNNNNVSMLRLTLNNLATAYNFKELHEKEISLYHEILDSYNLDDDRSILSAVYMNLSSAYWSNKQYEFAFTYAEKARLNALEYNKVEHLEIIYKQLSDLYKEKGNIDSSIYYRDEIIALRDSLDMSNEELTMLELEEEYNNKKLSSELQDSKADTEKALSKLSITIIVLIGIVLIAFLVFLLMRRYKKKTINLEGKVGEINEELSDLHNTIEDKETEIQTLQQAKSKNKLPFPKNLTPLTERECDVLQCASKGLKDQEIADELFISITTVRTHLRKAYVKIDAKNRAQAVQFCNEYVIRND